MSLQKLVYLDGQQAVIFKGLKHNPTLGRNFERMNPLEWLARPMLKLSPEGGGFNPPKGEQ